jgi:myo-inositol-1(or 4)-monophosphatase
LSIDSQASGIDSHALDLRLEAVKALAREAGELARSRFLNRDFAIAFKGPHDYLTEVDKEVEQFLAGRIADLFPDDGFLGEEGSGRAARAGHPIWVVDPIDGTANFAHGVPHFCVSIAAVIGHDVEIGVIYDPMVDELFTARRGGGALLNGAVMKAAATTELRAATVEVGWNARSGPALYLGLLGRVVMSGASPLRCGSGALGLAYVAAGRRDAYAENFMNSWDCLAAVALIKEAGGYVSNFLANDGLNKGNSIVAAAPALKDKMLEVSAIEGLVP